MWNAHITPQSWWLGQRHENGTMQKFDFIGNMVTYADSVKELWSKLIEWGVPKNVLEKYYGEVTKKKNASPLKKKNRINAELENAHRTLKHAFCLAEGTIRGCLNLKLPNECEEIENIIDEESWQF
mmetsp:Transcript_10478/g.15630  ORF Transcript_10478/g.15630 Transcript_10478/m.15630 type:complete len:126 (+) Transcript_10478:847-1224(+)